MSASRVSAAVLAAWLLAGTPAAIFAEEPLRLWRPAPERAEPRPPDAPVETAPLEPLDRESVGLLDGRRGLGADLWAKSERAEVAALIRALPPRIESATLHALARRLLLTAAPAPRGESDGPSLTALRAAALATLGAAEDAAALLQAAGPREGEEAPARLALDLELLRHDLPAACETARAGIGRYPEPYWQKVLAFCQAKDGERDQASLGAGLLREAGHQDPAFFALLEAALGAGPATLPPLSGPAPLHLAMLRAAGRPVPAELLTDAKPALLRAIALAPNAEPDLRLDAAERAVAAQALDPAILAELYGKAEATAAAADLAAEAPQSWTPRLRAAFYQAAAGEADPAARAGLLQRAWTQARARGGWEALVRAALPLIAPMQPGGRLAFFADDAARAWLLAGEPGRARAWAALARREAEGNPRAARAATALAPLLALADPKGALWSDDAIARWWELQAERDPLAAARRGALVFTLLDALGAPVPQRAWTLLRGEPAPPPAALPPPRVRQGLETAAADGRRGETVLYAVLAASASADAWTHPPVLQGVVRALRQVGLDAEARALAVEAALAAGV